jgi:cell division septum initiation protein DivIVA
MYTIYDDHIEVLEAENQDLKQEILILKRRLKYYKSVNENLIEEIDG